MKKNKVEEEETSSEEQVAQQINLLTTEPESILRTMGIYYITGEITTDSLKTIQQDILLKHLTGPKVWDQEIQLIINSGGGLTDEAYALLDLIQNIRMDVRTVGLGTCGSAAAILLAAGTKGKRTVGPSTTIMVHRYSWGTYDKHHELVAHRSIEDEIHNQMVNFWTTHSKYKTKKDVEKHLLKTVDNWMTPQMAIDHGIIDKISSNLR